MNIIYECNKQGAGIEVRPSTEDIKCMAIEYMKKVMPGIDWESFPNVFCYGAEDVCIEFDNGK